MQAVKMTKEYRLDTNAWPQWLIEAYATKRVRPLRDGCGSCLLIVQTPTGERTLFWDHWIVKTADGRLYIQDQRDSRL